jgi:REP element-mobilizing transposase RayT
MGRRDALNVRAPRYCRIIMTTREARTGNTHGGKREGAGRKRGAQNTKDPLHAQRPVLSRRHPVHVMLVVKEDVPTLRQRCVYDAVRELVRKYRGRDDFRIVHISLQRSHLHLIVEAANEDALRWGMASFAIRTARAINRLFGRRGKVFAFRYKAKQIRTRDYARNAIGYVLNNWRRHREDVRGVAFDPYSSASTFKGWARNKRRRGDTVDASFKPLPVSAPRTSLLRIDWTWYGLVDPYEVSPRHFGPSAVRRCAPARRDESPPAPRAHPRAARRASRASA